MEGVSWRGLVKGRGKKGKGRREEVILTSASVESPLFFAVIRGNTGDFAFLILRWGKGDA